MLVDKDTQNDPRSRYLMKKCYKCDTEKPVDLFSRDASRSDGLSNKCKACRKGIKSRVFTEHVHVERKTCTKCRLERDRTDFRSDIYRRDGLSPQCNTCRSTKEKVWRDGNKDSIRRRVRVAAIRAKQECRRFAVEYLLSHPCVDCGESDLLVLDFDHLEPALKRYSISKLLSGTTNSTSLKRVKSEIEKCVVRCSNCHRRRTVRQFGSWKLKYLESNNETD